MRVTCITTTFPADVRQTETITVPFVKDAGIENQVINLYPGVTYQQFEGFGGAFTESAGYVYSLLDQDQKRELLSNYFDASRMNYQFGRITLDSCDFSLSEYEAMSDEHDRAMKTFSLKRLEKYVLPFVRDAQKAADRSVEFMVSPWSTYLHENEQGAERRRQS